jgi:predicted acyltransferase
MTNTLQKSSERFLSLDVFRGMTICFMIIVNNPGGDVSFSPLDHAHWFGFTPTDLVFPSFLFAMGNAMSFSMKKFIGQSNLSVILKIIKRSALIFLVAYCLEMLGSIHHGINGGWSIGSFSHMRILGVLPRIALCYLFAALMVYFIKSKNVVIAIGILFLLGYWAILRFFGDPNNHFGMLTNVGTTLDKLVLGENHMYHGEGPAFDPEGILSTIPSIVNVICGYYAGKFIQEKGKTYEMISKLLLFGFLFIFLALCWNMSFPIAKKLWTSSFVLLTVGIDLVLISALIYVVEMKARGNDAWVSFFNTFGKNPLAIYVFGDFFGAVVGWFYINKMNFNELIDVKVFLAIAPGAIGSLLFAIYYMLVCWVFGKILDKRKIYIRV